jgi:DNA-binding LacI/PurR family transcriptional regulator
MAVFEVKTKYRDLGLPKYLQIKHTLKSEIEKGILLSGHKLPALRDMAGRFGVSYLTMRQAVTALESEGLVRSMHGKGVFISDNLPGITSGEIKKAKAVTYGAWSEGDYTWNVLHLIESKLQKDNTELVFILSDWSSTERILDDETDCYYFIAPPAHALPKLHQMAADGYRFAVIGSSWADQKEFFCVDSDNYDAAKNAAEFLISSGHTKIGFIRAPYKGNTNSADRLRGMKDALQEGDIEVRHEWCTDMVWDSIEPVDIDAFGAAVRSILLSSNPPTALIVDGANIVAMVYGIAYTCGIRIPEQLSVVGFDDNKQVCLQPPVTTFCQPLEQMVDTAKDYLHSVFSGKDVQNGNTHLPCTLIKRASTASLSER